MGDSWFNMVSTKGIPRFPLRAVLVLAMSTAEGDLRNGACVKKNGFILGSRAARHGTWFCWIIKRALTAFNRAHDATLKLINRHVRFP